MKRLSIKKIRKAKTIFCKIQHIKDLERVLQEPAYQIQINSMRPTYHVFPLRKPDGSNRWIENPEKPLKQIQKKLNYFLQCAYYFSKPQSAYGFVMVAKKDPDPRNILTNAQRHLGQKWLYNADVEDFFHQIKWQDVFDVFQAYPFEFSDDIAELLTNLTTHNGRLPMGAPTSPVLSNYACIKLDAQFQNLADWSGWVYTRFVDDLSFSSKTPFSESDLQNITDVAEANHLPFNPEKKKLLGPDDTRQVTGLVLGEKVHLPQGYMEELNQAIQKLGNVIQVQRQMKRSSNWVKKYQQKVEGMHQFATYILGEMHPDILKLDAQLEQALNPEEQYGAMSWIDFNYFKF